MGPSPDRICSEPEDTLQEFWLLQQKWAPRLELLFTTPENLSRYAQQMSLGRWPQIFYIRVCRTDVGGGQKIFSGSPGGLGFLREGGWWHQSEARGTIGVGFPGRPQVRFCAHCTLPLHLIQLICLVQSGILWKLCLQNLLVF